MSWKQRSGIAYFQAVACDLGPWREFAPIESISEEELTHTSTESCCVHMLAVLE